MTRLVRVNNTIGSAAVTLPWIIILNLGSRRVTSICCRDPRMRAYYSRPFKCSAQSATVVVEVRPTRPTAALHPLLHALLHLLLICFKLLFLVIVQNGFNLCLGVGVNALHLGHAVFPR